ncbi:MAG: response regulator transcription factor [Marinilabiliaceae bacterium]|nr:response regulator transcription factor [Marinilabiliaceae bacterium]
MGKELKIGIVDDNTAFRESLRFFIETILHHQIISETRNGKEFLTTALNPTPDILLMDIEMPILNGLEIAKLLIHQNYPAQIIAISNHSERIITERLKSIGFKGIINKNNIYAELPRAINRVILNQLYFPE